MNDPTPFGLLQQPELMFAFMRSAPVNLFFKDTECRYQFVTECCDIVNGGAENSILGKTDLEVQVYPEMGQRYYEEDKKILATGIGMQYVCKIPTPAGVRYFSIRKNPVKVDGKIIGISGLVEEVTEQHRNKHEVEQRFFRDDLTGLYNRNYLNTKAKALFAAQKFPLTVIMADCNNLKQVNDRYGHEYGDLLLKRVARVVRNALPIGSSAFRLGGDEFLILCSDCTAEKAQRWLRALDGQLKAASDDRLLLDVAFGACTVDEGPLDFESAYHLADQAMYRNKFQNRL